MILKIALGKYCSNMYKGPVKSNGSVGFCSSQPRLDCSGPQNDIGTIEC